MAQFTADQFAQLMAMISGKNTSRSFTQCSARFRGQRDPEAVNEFIAAITVYKDIEQISDQDAIKGMPLLLKDYAASWWMGVKDNVVTFKEATELLQATFSPPIPDWKLFQQITEVQQQKHEPSDAFICKKRVLFAKLNNPIAEITQVGMVFSLMAFEIRERLDFSSITTFDALISASRNAEIFIQELQAHRLPKEKCSYCRNLGHNINECHHRKADFEKTNEQPKPMVQPRSYTSGPGSGNGVSCYGCGTPGVYRANCFKCSGKTPENPQILALTKVSTNIIGHELPTVHIKLFGLQGEACFDTGAKTSIASSNLRKILTSHGAIFQEVKADVTLADGRICAKTVMSTTVDVKIGGRTTKIHFIALPNAADNRTLIGTDFMEQNGIILNMAQRFWYFIDDPKTTFDFTAPITVKYPMDITGEHVEKTCHVLPCSGAQLEVSKFLTFIKDKDVSPLPGTPFYNKTAHTVEDKDSFSPAMQKSVTQISRVMDSIPLYSLKIQTLPITGPNKAQSPKKDARKFKKNHQGRIVDSTHPRKLPPITKLFPVREIIKNKQRRHFSLRYDDNCTQLLREPKTAFHQLKIPFPTAPTIQGERPTVNALDVPSIQGEHPEVHQQLIKITRLSNKRHLSSSHQLKPCFCNRIWYSNRISWPQGPPSTQLAIPTYRELPPSNENSHSGTNLRPISMPHCLILDLVSSQKQLCPQQRLHNFIVHHSLLINRHHFGTAKQFPISTRCSSQLQLTVARKCEIHNRIKHKIKIPYTSHAPKGSELTIKLSTDHHQSSQDLIRIRRIKPGCLTFLMHHRDDFSIRGGVCSSPTT